ncbi:MAG TPA: hypothetical protein VG984_03885 [Candidatus Paceibacterota bacterium]|nr:hypothetical protein [Candidatus Paceibacterota bacterium]
MQEGNKRSVDGLHEKLYSRTEDVLVDPAARTPLSPTEAHADTSWAQPGQAGPSSSLMAMASKHATKKTTAVKFLIGSGIFFVLAAGAAAYLFFGGANSISPKNIDMQVVMPTLVDGGKQTQMQVLIHNRNSADLKLVDLIVNYPDGTRDPKSPADALLHERQSLGTIAAGEQLTRTAQAIFYGQEGQTQTVTVELQYSVEGSNAIFEKDATITFTVGSSPVSISVASPTEAIAGQEFAFDLTVQSNAAAPLQDVVIQGQYPFGFRVTGSSPLATAGGTLWRLGSMQPGETKKIHVTGTLDGQDGDARVFYFLAGSDPEETNTTISVPFLSVPKTLTVRRAFITAQIAINGQTSKNISVPSGTPVQGTITWTNNLPDAVSDAQITLSLSGPTLDTSTVNGGNGFYDSSKHSIVWSKDTESSLANVPPGKSGTLPFSFSMLPTGANGTLYSNPVIDLNITVNATRQGQSGVPETVSSAASASVLLASNVALTAQASHFSGDFSNAGPMPPVSGQSTTYGITWTVTNSSNTIANATVQATLPSYVTYVQAAQGSGIVYDQKSRTVTWSLGDVKAGAGYTSASRTGSFQVSLTPSTSQVGQAPALTGTPSLTAQDRFAQVQVHAEAGAPTTQLQNEPGYSANMGTVTQ